MGDIVRRYWPLHLIAIGLLVIVLLFAHYLSGRQRAYDVRAERTRLSLCAILDRIPEQIDIGMDKARKLDRCGRPHPPTVFFGHPFPTPAPTVTVHATPAPGPTVIIQPQPAVTVTVRATPSARPSRTPSPRPTPKPSPSPTCFLIICA